MTPKKPTPKTASERFGKHRAKKVSAGDRVDLVMGAAHAECVQALIEFGYAASKTGVALRAIIEASERLKLDVARMRVNAPRS